MKLGIFEIDALSDGPFLLDGGQMFGVVPKVLWEKKMPADQRNRVRMSLNCLLIRAGRHNIVVETGIGDKFEAKLNDIYGVDHAAASLPGQLKERGLDLTDIDIVINTHLHFDHCGWNTSRQEGRLVPTFPRARYFIQRGEWAHALQPTEKDRASYVRDFFEPAEKQTEFLEGEAEIVPGVKVEIVRGHTEHMQCVRIESEGEQAYFISDLVPTQAHLALPWIMSFDLYPLDTLENKRRILPELALLESIVVFPHDPTTPWVRLMVSSGKMVVTPVS